MSGIQPDIQALRKISGVTLPSRTYESLASRSPFLKSIAPSLQNLGPSKLLTYWSALAGNEKALQSLGGMAAVNRLRAAPNAAGISTKELFGEGINSWTKALRNRTLSMDLPFSSVTGDLTWGKAAGGMADMLRTQQNIATSRGASTAARAAAGEVIGTEAGLMGKGAGGISNFFAGLINKGMASGNPLMKAGGTAIPGAARFLGGVTAGVDLFTLGSMAFSGVGKGFMASLQIPSKVYMGVTAGIHRGTFMSSSSLSPFVGATGRQRAMANIYDRQLNLRQVLGNEAAMIGGY